MTEFEQTMSRYMNEIHGAHRAKLSERAQEALQTLINGGEVRVSDFGSNFIAAAQLAAEVTGKKVIEHRTKKRNNRRGAKTWFCEGVYWRLSN